MAPWLSPWFASFLDEVRLKRRSRVGTGHRIMWFLNSEAETIDEAARQDPMPMM